MSNASSTSTTGAGISVASALTIHTATLIAFLAASSAPSPLYRLYQSEWSFSSGVLALVFGVYPLALLLALVFAGRLSDHLGRRLALSLALVLEIIAMGLFLAADDPLWLIAARTVQGVATGLAVATLGAALIDLHPHHGTLTNSVAPMTGMAIGALGATALVQLAPAPLHLVFVVLIIVFAIQLLLTWCAPETAPRRPGALESLLPRIAVPQSARAELLAVTPINVAIWALGGFYLSLMPSLIAKVTGTTSVWLGGLSVAALTFSGAFAILAMRQAKPIGSLVMGAVALLIGIFAILVGANLGMASVLLVGSMIAGIGFGVGFLGTVRRVMLLAAPEERAGLMAALYVESYLANSLPAILAGALVRRVGLLSVANIYGAALITLVLAGLALRGWSEDERVMAKAGR